MIRYRVLAALVGCTLFAQTRRFEVAAIRLNTDSGPMFVIGAGLHKGSLTAGKITQRQMLQAAFRVSPAQVIGPAWLNENLFDIAGRSPAGVPDSEFAPMFQTLLKERFHLETHFESREMPVYLLTVAKGGVRMAKYPEPATRPDDRFTRGFPMATGSVTMSQFAEMLRNQLDRPVIDQTGLQDRYNYFLSYARPLQAGDAAPDIGPPDLFTAIQQQLGLKLEPGKATLQVVVVDHMDRLPTDN